MRAADPLQFVLAARDVGVRAIELLCVGACAAEDQFFNPVKTVPDADVIGKLRWPSRMYTVAPDGERGFELAASGS